MSDVAVNLTPEKFTELFKETVQLTKPKLFGDATAFATSIHRLLKNDHATASRLFLYLTAAFASMKVDGQPKDDEDATEVVAKIFLDSPMEFAAILLVGFGIQIGRQESSVSELERLFEKEAKDAV